jgi:hypothetical protein
MILSTVDVATLASTAAAVGLLATLEDAGKPPPRVVLFNGGDGAWMSVRASDVASLDSTLARHPSVLIGVVRGPCLGPGAVLASRMDILFGVAPGVVAGPEVRFCAVSDEGSVADLVAQVASTADRRPHASCIAAATLRQSSLGPTSAGLVREALAYSLLQSGPEYRAWLEERTDAA